MSAQAGLGVVVVDGMHPEQIWAQIGPRVAQLLAKRRRDLTAPPPTPVVHPSKRRAGPPKPDTVPASVAKAESRRNTPKDAVVFKETAGGAQADDYEAFMAEVEDNEDEFNRKYVGDEEEWAEELSSEADEAQGEAPAASETEGDDAEDLFDDMRYGVNPANMARLEKKLVEPRTWEMRGEVRASQRPVDGLVTADLEFDRGLEAAPRPSPAAAAKIEDIIRLRIKDRLFDDRQPTLFDRQVINEQSRLPLVSGEKDRRGLAELYEDKYKADVLGVDEGARAQKTEEIEMRELFRRICYSIDQMSRLSFTPVNAPTPRPPSRKDPLVVDEKVGAVVTGDLLKERKDYGEVFRPRRKELVSRTEMTPEERKSLRRRIKRINHIRAKKIKSADRARSGLTLGETRLLEKNLGKVQRQISNARVKPPAFTRQGDAFKNLASRAAAGE